MKLLYLMSCCDDGGDYELWFTENMKCIGGYFNDDAEYRSEYFNPIFRKAGLDIKEIAYDAKVAEPARIELFGF